MINPEFIDWLADLKPSQWIMYGQAYGDEAVTEMTDFNFIEADQTFQDWLMECFAREHGEKIQGEDNGN